jgi:hypothetical protein
MGCINVELIAAHYVMNSVEETNFLLTNNFRFILCAFYYR